MSDYGQRIWDAIMLRGLTVAEFAEEAGVERHTLVGVLKGTEKPTEAFGGLVEAAIERLPANGLSRAENEERLLARAAEAMNDND